MGLCLVVVFGIWFRNPIAYHLSAHLHLVSFLWFSQAFSSMVVDNHLNNVDVQPKDIPTSSYINEIYLRVLV